MGAPRRNPPSPGRQWFVARRSPTLGASSFKAPLHGFPSSSGCRHARHVIQKLRRFSRFGRRLEDALPNSLRTPAVEAIVDRLGRPIFRRTIDPPTSALKHMHDPAQNAPIVLRLHATAIAWNKRLNPRPLPVAKPKQVRPHLLAPRFG